MRFVFCVLAVIGLAIAAVAAHDLPPDIIVQAFVKPEGQRLHLLVRAPLSAMQDVDYPTRGPGGVIDLARAGPALADAVRLWIVPGFGMAEDGVPLDGARVVAARVSLPSDRSFESYEAALAHVTGAPLPQDTELIWNQGMLDVLIDYDIRSDRAALTLRPTMARLAVRVMTVVRFLPPGGITRAFEWTGDPGLVRLDPHWYESARQFVWLGFTHILGGTDHLLFLLCLVIPVRAFRRLVAVVTAFALAHSITLAAAALGLAPRGLWFPPLIEVLIAASIVYMAIENVLAERFDHRWMVAFAFGLVHGFGFSFALRESLQFAGSHLLLSLLSFNVGVELGQILVLVLLIPLLTFALSRIPSPRAAAIVLSVIVAHTAWHWMMERAITFGRFAVSWPDIDAALAVRVADGLLLLVVLCGVVLWWRRIQAWVAPADSPKE